MSSYFFLDTFKNLPVPWPDTDTEQVLNVLRSRLKLPENNTIQNSMSDILVHSKGMELLRGIFGHSPFLSRLVLQDIVFFINICEHGPDAAFVKVKAAFDDIIEHSHLALMQKLRIVKSHASLIIAIADLTGVWDLEKITAAMSEIAELCARRAVAFLLKAAHVKGELRLPFPDQPEKSSGFVVLAMGKLGARELNYSSDIDLIVLFDRDVSDYIGPRSVETFFPRLTQELVTLLQERTKDGYAFRVDLRLRPDPSSTRIALSVAAAVSYYETVGQNWERAALIKARPIAGDLEAGYRFLRQIAPFIWRKHLDFAAIADIQSIKRQMDARTGGVIEIPGHNVKTGLGGIREIEFFAQIHQLIWGGREPSLRISGTCVTLSELARLGHIEDTLAVILTESYRFLRTVEHRLQMVDDQQTHSVPLAGIERKKLAFFLNYSDITSFEVELLKHLDFVHRTFADSFRGQGSLGGEQGKLSFTGVENDPQTVETLRKMGYGNPASVSEIIQGWHRGTRRATRNKRARELITELTPTLLKALASTVNPDQAFMRFDEFLSKLPAGVQLFSLFQINPHLLDLIAMVMGSAPALAETLSKNPNLLDAVLSNDFYNTLPGTPHLFDELAARLVLARDLEDEMEIIRRFRNEKYFQAGIQLIRRQIDAAEVGRYLSDIADICIEALLHRVEVNFAAKQEFTQGALVIIALGRLGARELTFGSDIDLIFVYSGDSHETYNKLSQRFIGAVTALTREGRLYEVDTRLRPSGRDGLLAVSAETFDKYVHESAWTFERMALTRARVITGSPDLRKKIHDSITSSIASRTDTKILVRDITELRAKITREFGSDDPWNLKYAHGGLMDIDFLAQFLVLHYGNSHPALIGHSTAAVFSMLREYGLLAKSAAASLLEAHRFLNALFVLMRLCAVGILDEAAAPQGLVSLIAAGLEQKDFPSVKAVLIATLAEVRRHWQLLLTSSHDAKDAL